MNSDSEYTRMKHNKIKGLPHIFPHNHKIQIFDT